MNHIICICSICIWIWIYMNMSDMPHVRVFGGVLWRMHGSLLQTLTFWRLLLFRSIYQSDQSQLGSPEKWMRLEVLILFPLVMGFGLFPAPTSLNLRGLEMLSSQLNQHAMLGMSACSLHPFLEDHPRTFLYKKCFTNLSPQVLKLVATIPGPKDGP